MKLSKILVVDDEAPIRKMLQIGLKGYGYEVVPAVDGSEALIQAIGQHPDLVILDINLQSYPNGVEVCRRLREISTVPIIILSVENDRETKIAALNAGADDYVNKPFYMDELEARIRAILRRRAFAESNTIQEEIRVKELRIDLANHRVFLKDEELHLTKTEYKLLHLLATHHGKVITYAMIIKSIWGGDRTDHFVRVFINTLRKKIGEEYIVTMVGVGYRFIDL